MKQFEKEKVNHIKEYSDLFISEFAKNILSFQNEENNGINYKINENENNDKIVNFDVDESFSIRNHFNQQTLKYKINYDDIFIIRYNKRY